MVNDEHLGRPDTKAIIGARPTAAGGGGSLREGLVALRGWSARRRLVTVIAFPLLLVVYASFGPFWAIWWAVPVALLSAGLAAAILASYVPEPGSGRLVDVGCTPCAMVAGASVLGSLVLRDTRPLDAGIAAMALGLLVFGMAQRIGGAVSCAVPR
jgi:hypothetical protein